MAFRNSGSIVIGQSESNSLTMNEQTLVGFTISGSVASTTTMTYKVSNDGSTFYPLYDASGSEVNTIIAGSARAYSFSASTFYPWNFVKFRLGTSASPVNQATYNLLFTYNTRKM